MVEMHNLRNETGGDETLPKSFVLACKVGQVVTVADSDIESLEPGEYDVVAEYTTISIVGQTVTYGGTTTLRRVR